MHKSIVSFKSLLIVGGLLLGASVVGPFYLARSEIATNGQRVWRVITTHDLPNYTPMMEQFDKVLRSGVFYPRWDPDFNSGYGTATANFYPPGTFYVTSLINAAVDNWTITLFILCALSLAASCFFFYALSRTFYSRTASTVAAVLYAIFPYHQLDLYWRGAIPEFVGFAFLPPILYFAYRLGGESRLRYYAGLGLFHGLYLLTHMPVGYLYTYTLALYAVIWALRERDFRIVLRIASGICIALLVSSAYWIPAALEGKYVYEWASEFFPYHSTYITMLPVVESFDKHIQEVFNFNGLLLIVTIVTLITARKKASRSSADQTQAATASDRQTRLWIILGVVTPFMSTSFSIYVSRLIPKIQIAVPPFRWLAISSLFTCLLVAATIDLLRSIGWQDRRRELLYKGAFALVIALNVWLTAHGIISDAFSKPTHGAAAAFSDSGFIPRNATLPGEIPNTPNVVIKPEGGASEVLKWLPTYREVAVRVDQTSEVRIKTYNFPGWTARIDGNVVPIASDPDGVQQITVPAGIHNIQTSFENTWPRTAGASLSILGFVAVIGLIAVDQLRVNNRPKQRTTKGEATESASALNKSVREQSVVSGVKVVGVIGLVGIAGAAILITTLRRSDSGFTGTSEAGGNRQAPTTGANAGSPTSAGANSQLYLPGKESVEVGVEQDVVSALIAAIATKNQDALDSLVQSGRAFKIANATRVQVLETTAGLAKVRILEGTYIMREGWVPERWIR